MKKILMTASIAVLMGAQIAVADEADDIAALKQQVEALQVQLQALTAQIDSASAQIQSNTEAAEVAVAQVETLTIDGGRLGGNSSWASNTRLGGYGELHYNNLDGASGGASEIDFHRFVLFVEHEFSNRLRFFSELELEHSLAGDGKPGEIELEQAYIEYDLTENITSVAGLFLIPVGIINETHEPPTFYGVERNEVEKNIIPSTWWEAGAGIHGHNSRGFSWDLAAHSGLSTPIEGGNAFKIRNGRQKVAEATAEDLAVTGRIRYTGIPGLELAASAQYQSD
ncbi:MAG: porin, partial [Proteobacteria bacterium]|nr:porin [Pseudomonadota bacterium]